MTALNAADLGSAPPRTGRPAGRPPGAGIAMTTTRSPLPTWQSGSLELPTATTPLGVKRALNKRLPEADHYSRRSNRRVIGGAQLPFGVRVLKRDMGMYRTDGAYAVTGGPRSHPSKGHLRAYAYNQLDAALADAWERVEEGDWCQTMALRTFPLDCEVEFSHRPRYGAKVEKARGVVVGHGQRWAALEERGQHPGYVTVLHADRRLYFHFRQLERVA